MPNHHATILGCSTCEHTQYELDNMNAMHCSLHNVPVRYYTICKNMKWGACNPFFAIMVLPLSRNTLYAHMDIPDMGHLPPEELVSVGKFDTMRDWDEKEFEHAYDIAEKKAVEKYKQRVNQLSIIERIKNIFSK